MSWRFRCPWCMSVVICRRIRTRDYRCKRCGKIFGKPMDTKNMD